MRFSLFWKFKSEWQSYNKLGYPSDEANGANKLYVDQINAIQDIVISDKASKTYVDAANAKQDIVIADKASKSYVDNEIVKIPQQTQNVLLLDGCRSMTGNLDIESQNILNLENLTDYKGDDPIDYRIRDLKSAVNKEYLNTEFLKKRL